MKRSTKKGFTIVELVIVIAIIAILAAVLIPTFASLIQKANTSADIQACREMNTFLAVNEVTGNKDITDVYAALAEGGMTAKDYHPLVSGRFFFWDKTLNRVLYTDEQYKVIYPEEYKDVNKEKNGWLSLSGEIRKEKIEATNGTYIVTKAEQLYYLASEGKATNVSIKLNTKTLDLMGANISFSFDEKQAYTFEEPRSPVFHSLRASLHQPNRNITAKNTVAGLFRWSEKHPLQKTRLITAVFLLLSKTSPLKDLFSAILRSAESLPLSDALR